MKSIIFQLIYQAASTVLSLFYAHKYQLGKKSHDLGRKQHVMKNVLTREDNDIGRNSLRN